MPFTISHVAAVLPFSRPLARWRLLSATIVGSMVPDFGFLMPWRPARIETHSAMSLLTFCLPVGLATFWMFQLLIKTAIMEILPDAAYARWHRFAAPANIGSITQWVLAACGVLAGAVTHLVWDAFTHEGARGVRMIPVLDDTIVYIGGHHLIGARLLQDASSLAGLVIVLAVVVYGLRPGHAGKERCTRMLPAGERYIWISAYAAMTLLLAGFFFVARHPAYSTGASVSILIANCAIAALRGFAAALAVVSLCVSTRLRANPPGPRATNA
ncbi:MAG: hypothetical protein JWN43_1366 [Gammaproteobacteria bacterium]|nr:hypothetical protein [Gammaproteobacteria bacterium]